MASMVEMHAFQGSAGLGLPAGIVTTVGSTPVPSIAKKVQATVQVGILGGAIPTQVEVVASVLNSAGVAVASGGAFVDIEAGENLSVNCVVQTLATLPVGSYTVAVTVLPVAVLGGDASCQVQPRSNQDAVLIGLIAIG